MTREIVGICIAAFFAIASIRLFATAFLRMLWIVGCLCFACLFFPATASWWILLSVGALVIFALTLVLRSTWGARVP